MSYRPSPGIAANPRPFRLICKDKDDLWNYPIDDICGANYDHVKLHRISTSLDIGLPHPYCMHIGFDGTLIIPPIQEYLDTDNAIQAFNEVLAQIFLGGIFFEPVGLTDLDYCFINRTGYFRTFGLSSSLIGQLRFTLRSQMPSTFHTFTLHKPDYVLTTDIHNSRSKGQSICKKIPNLAAPFLLVASSAFKNHNWSLSLINFWIITEQTVSFLWNSKIIRSGKFKHIVGRKSLLKDHRTWSISTKLELFYQLGYYSDTTYNELSIARKARNDLIHNGKAPSKSLAESALKSSFYLLGIAYNNDETHFSDIISLCRKEQKRSKRIYSTDQLDFKSYPLDQTSEIDNEDTRYIRLPDIPGDPEWGDKPYEKVFKN